MQLTPEEQQQLVSDFKRTFSTDSGINVLRKLSEFCLENANPYVAGSFDQTARNCGKLSVVLLIRKMLATSSLPRQEKVIQTEKDE